MCALLFWPLINREISGTGAIGFFCPALPHDALISAIKIIHDCSEFSRWIWPSIRKNEEMNLFQISRERFTIVHTDIIVAERKQEDLSLVNVGCVVKVSSQTQHRATTKETGHKKAYQICPFWYI